MARILLVTAGVMEERALGRSSSRLYPDHEFVSRTRLDGFTSAKLPSQPPLPKGDQSNLDEFAGNLIGVFDPGNRRDRSRPDFVVAVEDVELHNADDPRRITASLRDSLMNRLARWPAKDNAFDRLADLEDMLGRPIQALPTERSIGDTHPLTWPPPRDPVLRNL